MPAHPHRRSFLAGMTAVPFMTVGAVRAERTGTLSVRTSVSYFAMSSFASTGSLMSGCQRSFAVLPGIVELSITIPRDLAPPAALTLAAVLSCRAVICLPVVLVSMYRALPLWQQ